jgi:hypothetical protein
MSTRRYFATFAFALFASAALVSGALLDEGKFDTAWFGPGDREYRKAEEIDYLWVKPGFTLAGKSVEFAAWEEPNLLGKDAAERDAKDKRMANDISRNMPSWWTEAFENALKGKVNVVPSGGTVRVSGQIVDCSEGSAAAKFWVGMGAGSGNTTFNLKFVDAASGEVVVAIHHRVVSGSNLSTTDSKLIKWIDELADELAKKELAQLYEKGKRVKA